MISVKGHATLIALAAALISAVLLAYAASPEEAAGAKDTTRQRVSIVPSHIFDVEDEKKLVGFSEHVFVGRVVERAGTKVAPPLGADGAALPQTQFRVQVEDNIKGELGGDVVVNQVGGLDQETGRLFVVDGDQLLEPEQTYLFATRYDEKKGWHEIAAQGHSNVPFKGKSTQERKELKEKFKKAKQNQVDPFDVPSPKDKR